MTLFLPPTRLDGRVLVVAGSEASGGTGIEADVKTLTALGVHAMTSTTTLGVYPLPPEIVADRMRTVLTEIGADCIKIGALTGAATIDAVAEVLEGEARGLPLVLEGGATTVSLIRFARLVVLSPADAELAKTARAALVVSDDGDVLVDGPTQSSFAARRVPGRPVEGIVTTLAAAIAGGLARRLPLAAAVKRGRDYVQEAILTAPDPGHGLRHLNHAHTVRPSDTEIPFES